LIKNGVYTRENYYNWFYGGQVLAEAERRQIIVPSNDAPINDTISSIIHARRQPRFPNSRALGRRITVRCEADVRPAIYQVAFGDTLFDIQGNRHITHRDSVIRAEVWINGPATGEWQSFGAQLRADTTRKMYDDGTHGDRIAMDSIFTRIIVASPESLGIGTKGQVGQVFKLSLGGGDNEAGRGGIGNNHLENIDDATSTFTLYSEWGSINPAFYRCWDYEHRFPPCPLLAAPEKTNPLDFSLMQNYPNPFNPITTIEYELSSRSFVTLKIFDLLGREVATIVSETQNVGRQKLSWESGNLSSGVYFYTLKAGSFVATRKLLLLR
jgi:hypothetical protein